MKIVLEVIGVIVLIGAVLGVLGALAIAYRFSEDSASGTNPFE